MSGERHLNERPAARPNNPAPKPEPVVKKPADLTSIARLRRIAITWGVIAAVALVGAGVGGGLANAGTTRTWICLGSSFECEAIQTTALGSFGIFLQWTLPLVALISLAICLTFRSAWKSEVKEYQKRANPI